MLKATGGGVSEYASYTDQTCIYSVPLVQEWICSYEDLC